MSFSLQSQPCFERRTVLRSLPSNKAKHITPWGLTRVPSMCSMAGAASVPEHLEGAQCPSALQQHGNPQRFAEMLCVSKYLTVSWEEGPALRSLMLQSRAELQAGGFFISSVIMSALFHHLGCGRSRSPRWPCSLLGSAVPMWRLQHIEVMQKLTDCTENQPSLLFSQWDFGQKTSAVVLEEYNSWTREKNEGYHPFITPWTEKIQVEIVGPVKLILIQSRMC